MFDTKTFFRQFNLSFNELLGLGRENDEALIGFIWKMTAKIKADLT